MRSALFVTLMSGLALLAPPAVSAPEPTPEMQRLPGRVANSPQPDELAARPWDPPATSPTRVQALTGKVIVIDPGHQLGNATDHEETNRLVNAGGFRKPCNSTGASTNAGYPEATFTWRVARALKRQLENKGATVRLTRQTNSVDDLGPCVNTRGRKGNRLDADVVVSVHGDGAASGARGFFVIRPGYREGWTDDILRPSHRLSRTVKAGLVHAGATIGNTYGGDGLDTRTDLGTLNWSDKPIVMVELGNMRNAIDAKHMTSPKYRRTVYAKGLRIGITRFLQP